MLLGSIMVLMPKPHCKQTTFANKIFLYLLQSCARMFCNKQRKYLSILLTEVCKLFLCACLQKYANYSYMWNDFCVANIVEGLCHDSILSPCLSINFISERVSQGCVSVIKISIVAPPFASPSKSLTSFFYFIIINLLSVKTNCYLYS